MARPTLFSNRKFVRLAQRLQSRAHALGHLELIWNAAHETGNPVLGDADDVEAVADWRGTRGELVAALLECGTAGGGAGFIIKREDGRYEIHDYWDHAPDYVRKRAKREQIRRENGAQIAADTDRSERASKCTTVQSLTGHADRSDDADRSNCCELEAKRPVTDRRKGHFGRTPSPSPAPLDKTPLPPRVGVGSFEQGRREDGANPRAVGTNPRAIGTQPRAGDPRARSLEAWRAATVAIDHVNATTSLTWAHVTTTLQDALADRAIERAGGHRVIADRDRYNQGTLEERFRTAYELLFEQQTATVSAVPKAGAA